MTPASKALACADAGASLRMTNFIDVCKLLGNYNDKDVYLYMSSKYKSNSIFYSPNYYLLPKWANAETLTFMQAVKIINFRMKHKNSDNINVKFLMDMCKDAPASLRRLTPCAADDESNNIDSLIQEIKEK